MAHVVRPPKAKGHNTYQGEVAAGKRDILDSEVDADFQTIYSMVDGGLDDYNVRAGAAIAYSKLNLTGQIKNADISAPPSPNPNGLGIDGSKITGKLPIGALAPNAVTWDVIAPLNTFAGGQPPVVNHGSAATVPVPWNEYVLQTITYNVRRGTLFCQGSLGMVYPTSLGGVASALVVARIWSGSVGGGLVAERQLRLFANSAGDVMSGTIVLHGNSIEPVGNINYLLTLT